jgi:hypothetical protein
VILPFTVRVPADAGPGDHVAGLVAAVRGEEVDAEGNRVDVERRVGARIYTRVPGAVTAAYEIEDLSVDWAPHWSTIWRGEVEVTATIVNVGNVRLAGGVTADVSGPGGALVRTTAEDVPEVLPGDRVVRDMTVSGIWPLVRLDSVLVARPSRSGDQDVEGAPGRAESQVWAVPWLAVGVVALLLAGIAALVIRRRRRRHRGGSPDGAGAPGEEPVAAQKAESGPAPRLRPRIGRRLDGNDSR